MTSPFLGQDSLELTKSIRSRAVTGFSNTRSTASSLARASMAGESAPVIEDAWIFFIYLEGKLRKYLTSQSF